MPAGKIEIELLSILKDSSPSHIVSKSHKAPVCNQIGNTIFTCTYKEGVNNILTNSFLNYGFIIIENNLVLIQNNLMLVLDWYFLSKCIPTISLVLRK